MNLEQIDTSTTAGKRRVMELAEQGRKLAYRTSAGSHIRDDHAKWGEPDWDWLHVEYAIIAEPVGPDEVWVAVGPGPTLEGARWNPSDAQRLLPGVEGQVVKYIRADLAGEGK